MQNVRLLPCLLRLLIAALLFPSVGCAPKIYSSFQKSYPARPEGSTVLVYNLTDTLPSQAEVLGSVEVRDNGLSSNCGFRQVLQRAKDATNNAGGNGLILTWHKEPSTFGSSCHQIAASVLRLPDSIYTASYFDNIALQNYRANLQDIPANTAQKANLPASSERKPCAIMINAGAAFVLSKTKTAEGVTGNPRRGLDINGAFQWTARSGLGFGLRYSGYFTSAKLDGTKFDIRLHYVGAEFVMRQNLGRKWAFHESIGLGYAQYSETIYKLSMNQAGLGSHVDLGIEYKLSRSVGLGFSIGAYSVSFNTSNYADSESASYKNDGIARLSLDGGLRFYF